MNLEKMLDKARVANAAFEANERLWGRIPPEQFTPAPMILELAIASIEIAIELENWERVACGLERLHRLRAPLHSRPGVITVLVKRISEG